MAGMPSDEQMLAQVQSAMGAQPGDFQVSGDMENDQQALVAMYQSGDPNDPATQQRWEQAKQDFIDAYGEENVPSEVEEEGEPNQSDAEEQAEDTRGMDRGRP